MRENKVALYILRRLKHLNIFKWHVSANDSIYLKFRNSYFGSIRIANHSSRRRYKYKYEIDTSNNNYMAKTAEVVALILVKQEIEHLDVDKFIVYDRLQEKYIEVSDMNQYKRHILIKRKGKKTRRSKKYYIQGKVKYMKDNTK